MMLKTFERLRRQPAAEKQRIVSLIAIVVMIAITVIWLPAFFLNIRVEQLIETEDRSVPVQPAADFVSPYGE